MPTFISQQISAPANWQDFERLCRDLWASIWGDPNAQRNGRGGQAQHGVDVFGQLGGNGDWQGVQAKGKDGRYRHAVTEAELKSEVEKAKAFSPTISAFILATTAPNDAAIQKLAREITEEHKANGLFSVSVFGWEEILSRLADYPKLVDKHFPDQGPTQHKTEEKIDQVLEQQMLHGAALSELPHQIRQEIVRFFESNAAISSPGDGAADPADEERNKEIDGYRDRIRSAPGTALSLLQGLRERCWDEASDLTRFRITTNIGSAHLTLAEADQAADCFLEATQFASKDNDKAARNAAFAYLLKGDLERAREESKRAIALNPDEGDAYPVFVVASATLDDVVAPEALVPKEHLSKANVAYAIGNMYRRRGDPENALKWLKQAYEQGPESKDFVVAYGSELLGRVIDRVGASLEGFLSDADLIELDQATNLLFGVWEVVKGTELAESYGWTGANLFSALSAAGKREEARKVLQELSGIGCEFPELRKRAAIFALEEGKPDAALEHLAQVPEGHDSEIDLLRAEALVEASKFEEALKAVDSITFPTSMPMQESAARDLRIRLLAKVEGTDAALNEARRIEAEHPDDPTTFLSLSNLFSGLRDDQAAKENVRKAVSLIRDGSTPAERYAVAEALYKHKLYADAIAVYNPLVNNYGDSQILRRLLVCLYQADQRQGALEILERIPETTKRLKFYRRYAAAFYMRSGEHEKALGEAGAYLAQEPNDLEMRLNWVALNHLLGNEDVIRDFLSATPDYPEAEPGDQIRLSQAFSQYGFPKKGIQLAYSLRREYQDVASVHLGYIGLILLGNLPTDILDVSTVGEDTAFELEDSSGAKQTFIIEGSWSDARFSEEIALTHPIAQQALGKSCGDTVNVVLNPLQTDERKIVILKSKYGYVFQLTTTNFSTRFPDEKAFWNVNVGTKDGDGFDFSPIFKALDDRQSQVLHIKDMYQTGSFPVGLIALLLGSHPLEVWHGFMQDAGFQIKCCAGTAPERNAALALAQGDTNNFVVDPLTLYSLVSLGVHEALTKSFGRFGVTQSSLDMYRFIIEETRLHSPSGTLAKIEDQYTFQQFTPEQVEGYLKNFEQIVEWAKENCDILPAVGDVPQDWIEINDHIAPAFIDTFLAAEAAGRLLLSDDQSLRAWAKQMKAVDGVWLQVLMLEAARRGDLPKELYCDATAHLIEAGVDFTTIDAAVLFQVAKAEKWIITDRFNVLLSTLGGKSVDIISSVRVALEFIALTWHENIEAERKVELTRALMNTLSENHEKMIPALLRAFVKIGPRFKDEERTAYRATIRQWCTDRGISLLAAIPMSPALRSHLMNTTSHLALR